MSAPDSELRRHIQYNSTDMGELGKFIRLEHVYAILDRFTIVDENNIEQTSRITAIRQIFREGVSDPRSTLEQIHRIVYS